MIELNKQYFRHRKGGVDYSMPLKNTNTTITFTIYYHDGRSSVITWLHGTFLNEWIPCTELLGALR